MSKLPKRPLKRPRIPRKPITSGLAMPVEIAGYNASQLFRLNDDSMAPEYKQGDIIKCTQAKEIKDIQSGWVVVVSLGWQSFLKRLMKTDGHLLLICDDRNDHLLKVEENEIRNVWCVDGKLRISDLHNETSKKQNINFPDLRLSWLRMKLQHLKN